MVKITPGEYVTFGKGTMLLSKGKTTGVNRPADAHDKS